MSLNPIVLGQDLNGEGVASLLNMARVSISTAAVNAEDAVQLSQLHAIRDALQTQLDAIDSSHHSISEVHVDTSATTLQAALDAGTYSSDTHAWTFSDGTVIGSGDSIILQAASDPSERSWIHTGGTTGTAADFEKLSSDIQAIVNVGVQSVTDALRGGVVEAGDTLAKLFTMIHQTQITLAGVSDRANANEAAIANLAIEVGSKVRAFYMPGTFTRNETTGIYEVNLGNPANFENARVTVKEVTVGGATRKISDMSYVETTSDSQVLLQTMAPSFENKEVLVIIEA